MATAANLVSEFAPQEQALERERAASTNLEWDDRFELQLKKAGMERLWALTDALRVRCPSLPISVARIADGLAVYHGGGPSSFVRELATTRPVGEAEIEEIEAFYATRRFPVRIWISDRTEPSLVKTLRARGYVGRAPLQMWWLSLEGAAIPEVNAAEVLVVSGRACEQWATTVSAGFMEGHCPLHDACVPAEVRDLYFSLGCAWGDQPFVARREKEYVGGAVLTVFGEVAMLRAASTRYVCRNQGIQQTLISARLRVAVLRGARVAVAQTPIDGPSAHNLRKFGFKPLRSASILEKIVGCRG
jgi:hypothetical protein